MRARALLAGLVSLVAITACTAEPTEDAPAPVEHPKAERPADRDERAVMAALAQLDFCAVLGAAVPGNQLGASDPTACYTMTEYGLPDVRMSVANLSVGARLGLPSRPVGGAKAYLRFADGWCGVLFPVSFQVALEFTAKTCELAEPLAAAATVTLADPTAARTASRWNACDALRVAVDDEFTPQTDPDQCATDGSGVSLGFGFEYPDPDQKPRPVAESIGNTQVWVRETTEDPDDPLAECTVSWTVAPTNPLILAGAVPTAIVSARDCAQARTLAEDLIPAMREAPPAEVSPQHPLLYAPDEPDSPEPGACAYASLARGHGCEPYVEVPVPGDAAAVLDGSAADPNVTCAVVRDEVTAGFGARFQPVTAHPVDLSDDPEAKRDGYADLDQDYYDCVFVEPERLLQIEFQIRPEPLAREGSHPELTDVEYAGHPGRLTPSDEDFRVLVSTSTTDDEGSTISFIVSAGPATPLPVSSEHLAAAETVLTEILENHFS